MADAQVYKTILTEFIKQQIIILGPNVALGTARKVTGLKLSEDGTVTDIDGDAAIVLKAVRGAYINLAGEIAQMTFQKVLDKYPELHQTG